MSAAEHQPVFTPDEQSRVDAAIARVRPPAGSRLAPHVMARLRRIFADAAPEPKPTTGRRSPAA